MTQLELIKYRTSLKKRYADLADANRNHATLAIEPAAEEMDQTQGVQERDLAIGGFNPNSKLLQEVRSALARFTAGTFGVCVDCGFDITSKRLAAIPWAASCIVCEAEAESRAIELSPVTEESGEKVA